MSSLIVLASSSPWRRELLARLKLRFEVMSPDVDESPRPGEKPTELVARLAADKARAVGSRFPSALVIGSDQVAVQGDSIVGKPHTHEQAVAQLREASGRIVTLYTGLALLNAATGSLQTEVIPYRVHFRKLDESQIENYLRAEAPYQCAGAVRSEGLGVALFERHEGDDPATLIGLPLIRLVRMLENEGVRVI